MSAKVYGLSVSPWTERALWALDHHGVSYRYREYVPMVEAPLLKWWGRALARDKATVPLYTDGAVVLGDSLDIMVQADEAGDGAPLESRAAGQWAQRVEPVLCAVRARVAHRMLADQEALTEAARMAVPDALAPLCKPLTATAARYLAKKYGFDAAKEPDDVAVLRPFLDEVRQQLGTGPYLGDSFAAADIIAATVLHGLSPHKGRYQTMCPATRRLWARPELAQEYGDLMAWRDGLYARHRKT